MSASLRLLQLRLLAAGTETGKVKEVRCHNRKWRHPDKKKQRTADEWKQTQEQKNDKSWKKREFLFLSSHLLAPPPHWFQVRAWPLTPFVPLFPRHSERHRLHGGTWKPRQFKMQELYWSQVATGAQALQHLLLRLQLCNKPPAAVRSHDLPLLTAAWDQSGAVTCLLFVDGLENHHVPETAESQGHWGSHPATGSDIRGASWWLQRQQGFRFLALDWARLDVVCFHSAVLLSLDAGDFHANVSIDEETLPLCRALNATRGEMLHMWQWISLKAPEPPLITQSEWFGFSF